MEEKRSKKKKKFIIFGAPKIGLEKLRALKVMESGWLGTGPKVLKFMENEFKKYKKLKMLLQYLQLPQLCI